MTSPPTRWLDDPDVSSDVRALLESAEGPTEHGLAQIWSRIEATLAQGGGAAPHAAGHAARWTAGKVLVLVVAGVLVSQLLRLPRGGRDQHRADPGPRTLAARPTGTLPAPLASGPTAPPVASPSARAALVPVPAPAGQPVPAVRAHGSSPQGNPLPRGVARTPPPADLPAAMDTHASGSTGLGQAPLGIDEEVHLLARAHALLDADPAEALAIADARTGLLADERETLAIEALIALHRHREALVRANRFLAAHPASTASPRVRELRDEADAPTRP